MENKKIYIIVTQTGTIVSRIIKFFTKAPYNHSSICGEEKLNQMYSFCRYNKKRPLPAGFSKKHVNTCVFGMYDYIPSAVYSIDVTDEQYARYENMISYFHDEVKNYSFNLMGFVGGIFKVAIPRKKKLVCSQFVAYVLRECGIYAFEKDLFLVTPDDFRSISQAKLIFEGNLRDYYNKINGIYIPSIPVLGTDKHIKLGSDF